MRDKTILALSMHFSAQLIQLRKVKEILEGMIIKHEARRWSRGTAENVSG